MSHLLCDLFILFHDILSESIAFIYDSSEDSFTVFFFDVVVVLVFHLVDFELFVKEVLSYLLEELEVVHVNLLDFGVDGVEGQWGFVRFEVFSE